MDCGATGSSEPSSNKISDEVRGHLHHDDVAQLTRLRSEPHKLLSRRLPGKAALPVSPVKMLAGREANFSGRSRFSSADSCHVLSRYFPQYGPHVIDKVIGIGYVSQFSHDGSLFVTGFMGSGGRIRIYDVDRGWNVRNHINTKDSAVVDTCLSPDKCLLVYSNFSAIIYAVNVGSAAMESLENITEIHECLNFTAGNDRDRGHNAHKIFSVKFSTDGRELVAGSSDTSIYVYDLGENRLSLRVPAHRSLVFTACFADESGQIIYSGSDDGLCKVWDRRRCLIRNEEASGVLVGHLQGVTFIDSRGDGRHLISNALDETIKLWDIRKMSSNLTPNPIKGFFPRRYGLEEYPRAQRNIIRNSRHPNDSSLATYKGHEVYYGVPVRCYFSPEKSTGQKYIYTGSTDGSVYIYDLLSGAQVAKLNSQDGLVRDCSWHPYIPTLVSSSWGGVISKWDFAAL